MEYSCYLQKLANDANPVQCCVENADFSSFAKKMGAVKESFSQVCEDNKASQLCKEKLQSEKEHLEAALQHWKCEYGWLKEENEQLRAANHRLDRENEDLKDKFASLKNSMKKVMGC